MADDEPSSNEDLNRLLTVARIRSEERGQEMGYLAKFFGGPKYAPTSIAGIVALTSLVVLLIIVLAPVAEFAERADLAKIIISIITGALGYLFGSLSGGKD